MRPGLAGSIAHSLAGQRLRGQAGQDAPPGASLLGYLLVGSVQPFFCVEAKEQRPWLMPLVFPGEPNLCYPLQSPVSRRVSATRHSMNGEQFVWHRAIEKSS